MKKSISTVLAVVVVVGIAGGIYWSQKNKAPEPAPITQAAPTPIPSPAIRYPVPADPLAGLHKTLPALNESDLSLQEMLVGLFGKDLVDSLFNPKEIIRRFVVTVENARESQLPIDFLPFNFLADSFRVVKKNGHTFIDDQNADRYQPYRKLAEAADAKNIAAVYFHFYPLIQAAYQEISNHGYFNDRLIQVIDQALATPTPPSLIEVVARNKSYKYADEKLEKLSAIQKVFLRMGNENAKAVKEKLLQLRNLLILGV